MEQALHTPIEYLKGIGPERGKVLREELGIQVFADLLEYFPFRYIDLSQWYTISQLHEDVPIVLVKGKLVHIENAKAKGTKRLTAILEDSTGSLELVWFAGIEWVKPKLKLDMQYVVCGKPSLFGSRLQMVHPELEPVLPNVQTEQAKGLRPVYNTTEKLKKKGLDSRAIEKLMRHMLAVLPSQLPEILPPDVVTQHQLIHRTEALRTIHFPQTLHDMQRSRFRFKFEELLLLQLQYLRGTQQRIQHLRSYPLPVVGEKFNAFYHKVLPFELTNAQKRVVKEIHHGTREGRQMNRLLQGDVGSGKTLVAVMAMLLAVDNGLQAALMAPTEILARQHYHNIKAWMGQLNIATYLLTGSTPNSERREIGRALQDGRGHILIGTHALIEERVQFKSLGMAIIDEQHRFGVAQRAKLWEKSDLAPHVLVMTATPIPRTLAMTLYGDLETSVLDELPPGRKPVETKHLFENSRLRLIGFMREQIAAGRQVYVVYPLIDESEKLDLSNLISGHEGICRDFPAPQYRVGMLHGKLRADDKEFEMQRFKNGETQILVATTVIEVGVDVPNASVMVIENADRFGLSQLHQLRGRVGRGSEKSYCILMTGHKLSKEARKRLDTMVATNDGFVIAEADLEIRGPGDMSGTLQSGLPNLKVANLATDGALLGLARSVAKDLLQRCPKLDSEECNGLKSVLDRQQQSGTPWSLIA